MAVSADRPEFDDAARPGCARARPHAVLVPASAITARAIEHWQHLAANASEPNPFHEPWFLLPALREFASDDSARLFLLWQGEPGASELIGLLPLASQRRYGRWPVPHIQNWLHPNCFLGTPLVRAGSEALFWEHLLPALEASDWPGFLHLNGLGRDGPVERALREFCAGSGRSLAVVQQLHRALQIRHHRLGGWGGLGGLGGGGV